MLTPADDYPVHQTPEPIALTIGERNFYDRYFFNGYSEDGETFFALAMGFYPQLGVVDGAFCVQRDGVQHNVRASKEVATVDRMDLSVGPISVEVVAPLRQLKVQIDHQVIQASLEFTARCPAVLEPRFTRRHLGRLFMDYSRLTQNGSWTGRIAVEGVAEEVDGALGTRDRSWGVRPVGASDSQPPAVEPQFFWLWTPINFSTGSLLYHLNADGSGRPWNESGCWVPLLSEEGPRENEVTPAIRARSTLSTDPDSKRIESMTVEIENADGLLEVELEPGRRFFMSGLGYTHASWGHGHARGPLDVSHDVIDLNAVDEDELPYRHIQALCTARVKGREEVGQGVVEQLFIGPYEPQGF